MAPGSGSFTKNVGSGSLDAACLEGMHSWRKLKLEKAVTLPAIQPQLAGVCLHRILLVTIWGRFLVEYDGEVMVCGMEVVVSMVIFVVEVTALFVNSWRIVPAWKNSLETTPFYG